EHWGDLSELPKGSISEFTEAKLNRLVKETELRKDTLSLIGLSAKVDASQNLTLTLLIRNGTGHDLELTQLPLKLYDAAGDLSAQGTFRLDKVRVVAHTSKP